MSKHQDFQLFVLKLSKYSMSMSNFQPFKIVDRGSKHNLAENINKLT